MAGVNTSINNFKCREGNRKWKTTRKAVSAAEQKVVESTAMQVEDQEFHAQAHAVLKGYLARATSHADHLEKVLKEEASATTDREDHSARTTSVQEDRSERTAKDQEGHLERIQKEDSTLTDHADHLERTASVQEGRSVRTAKDQEDHSARADSQEKETLETESQEDSEIQAERASTEGISTTSVTRMKAESTR